MSNGVVPARVRPANFVWGYDGQQTDPAHRVSVNPNGMILDTLTLNAVERGVLLTIFLSYWRRPEPRPVEQDEVRGAIRLSKAVLDAALKELVVAGCVEMVSGGFVPASSFGPFPKRYSEPRQRRDMPSDWLELRERVFARDGYSCVYCGSGADLHCDHVEPVALGGSHDIENLVTACAPCNLSKGSKTVAEWRPDIWEAMKR